VRACVPEKIFPGATPPDPQRRGRGEEGEGREEKGGQREGEEGRKGKEEGGEGDTGGEGRDWAPPMFDTDRRPCETCSLVIGFAHDP
jgi:hypothetical protein